MRSIERANEPHLSGSAGTASGASYRSFGNRPSTRSGTGSIVAAAIVAAGALGFVDTCSADHAAVVRLSYATRPAGGGILESGLKLNVSHVDASWTTRWNEGGAWRRLTWTYSLIHGYSPMFVGVASTEVSFDNRAADLWVNMARSRLQAAISRNADRNGIELTFVDRDHTADIVREKDMEDAGIVDAPPPGRRRAKVLDVDAKFYGKVDIDVKIETGTRKTIQGISAWYRPCGWRFGASVRTGEKQKIRRIITINAEFRMEDSKTGRIWAQHQSSVQPIDTEKPGVFFSSSRHRIDFDQPDKQIVMAFLEHEIDAFVAKLTPTQASIDVIVESSSDKDCRRGVDALSAGDHRQARSFFEAAIRDDADDHRALFGAGVACEILGDLRAAEQHYKMAVLEGGDKNVRYGEAAARVRLRLQSP